MACGCGKTKPPTTTASSTTAPAQPAPIAPLGSEPELVGASR